jgi:exopolyphosphatase/pppGpp-phosphohydrolase
MTIIDIGGGSTEVISGTDRDFVGYVSLPLGSVRLTDAFVSHDLLSGKKWSASLRIYGNIFTGLSVATGPPLWGRGAQ